MAKVSQRSLVQRLDAASAEMSMSPAQLEQLDSLNLVHVFARCCDNHEKLSTTLVDIVKILRERRFYVDTPHEASTVRDLIKSACGATRKKADTTERYVSSLVKCLRMPPHVFKAMPSISITHLKLPNVEWYGVGDDVDMNISDAWSHAIVIETKYVVATNVNDVRIQYVGHPKGRKNPTWVNKAHLREHFPDTAVVGPDDTFSAASIKEDLRCKIQEIHKSPGQRSSSPSYRPESSSDGASIQSPRDDEVADSNAGPSPSSADSVQLRRSARDKTTHIASSDKEVSTTRHKSKPASKTPSTTSGAPKRPKVSDPPAGLATSRVEDFFWSTLPACTSQCIVTLELLDSGKDVHEDVEKEGVAMLTSRCHALHKLYGNAEFLVFLDVAVESLANYEGKENSYSRKFMVDKLRQFGFVISPRMWTKLELLMLMIIIMDPELLYMGIRQKDSKNERDQNR